MKKYVLVLMAIIGISQTFQAQEDNYLWLEEIDSQKSLEFVEKNNKATLAELSTAEEYQAMYDKSLAIYNSSDNIAYPTIHGDFVYNFWQDEAHVRGIWRRSSLASYMSENPVWETLLDIDELSKKDGTQWVYKGASGLYPDYKRFLVQLSDGGGDAVFIKEFDVTKKQFIENGFSIDDTKGVAEYVDENNLIVGSDFGEGTLTTSGYPRQVKLWKRGTPLEDAQLIYEGKTTDMATWGFVIRDNSQAYTMIVQAPTFFTNRNFVWHNDKAIPLDIPSDAMPSGILNDQMILQLKSDWSVNNKTYKTGSVISLNFTELMKGTKEIQLIIEPDEFSSISQIATTRNKLLVGLLTNVTSQLYIYTFDNEIWSSEKVKAPDLGSISFGGTNDISDDYFFEFTNFITPNTLYTADAANNTFKPYKSLPAFFDAGKYEIQQYKAKSKDGTMVPYFVVGSKAMKNDGTNPTLIYAYGGFEASEIPYYASTVGVSWLDKGGVYVVANIRGGGEYGPKWHQDGMKENRQNVFDDLYGVTEDLIARKISSPKHLGVMGGSNGGLLVGVAFTQRPDLYNAVVCQVPLLDMQRYNKLLSGASWIGEYGNPDIPEEWAYLKKYSPYHNLKEGMEYPEVFFATATSDDRVHPGHARKMVAKMNDMGYKTYYCENTEGGHSGSATNKQRAKSHALTFSYLLKKLM